MIDHINLLFINIQDSDLSAILETFRNNGISVNHQVLSDKNIDDDVFASTSYDLIIMSERDSSPSYLSQLSKNYSSIPIIYFTQNYSSGKAALVMNNGAKDCISGDQIARLMPIVKREVEHKKIRDDLQRTKNFKDILSDLSDLSTEEIYIFDSNTYKCIFTNNTAAQNCGYSKDEIFSIKPADIYNEYDHDAFVKLVSPLQNNKREKISICTNIRRKMGAIYPVETHFKRLEKGGESYLLASNKDISGAWFKIQKLKRQRILTSKFIQKNEEKKDLIANAAHDMRTSINSIILSNKLLNKKWKENSGKNPQKFTQTINFISNHLIQYIEEFFEVTEHSDDSDQIKIQNILLPEFGQKIYQTFKPVALEQDIVFHYNANNLHSKFLKSNPTYIKRILKNILSNAFKYTEEGSVTFNLYTIKGKEAGFEFEADDIVAFEVQDTGIGIPKADQKHIFNRFSRANTTSNSKGSGLGLDIAHELTEALGGKLDIESTVNIGSTFTLFLPNDEPSKADSTIENPHHLEKPLKKPALDPLDRSILVVDDSKVHNMAIKEFLSYTFNKCVTTQTPEEAFNVINNQSIDCVVLDYIIFDTNCLQIARKIRAHPQHGQMPIIIYTGKKLNASDRQKLTEYADAIVQKNTDSYNKLVSTIYSCLLNNSSVHYSQV